MMRMCCHVLVLPRNIFTLPNKQCCRFGSTSFWKTGSGSALELYAVSGSAAKANVVDPDPHDPHYFAWSGSVLEWKAGSGSGSYQSKNSEALEAPKSHVEPWSRSRISASYWKVESWCIKSSVGSGSASKWKRKRVTDPRQSDGDPQQWLQKIKKNFVKDA
jgi:hypothetical protein